MIITSRSRQILFIKKLRSNLNVQSESVRAKLFVWHFSLFYVILFIIYCCAASVAVIPNSVARKNLDSMLNHNPLRSQPQSFAHVKSSPRGLPTIMLSQLFCDTLMSLSHSFRFLLRVSRASHLRCRIRSEFRSQSIGSLESLHPVYLYTS